MTVTTTTFIHGRRRGVTVHFSVNRGVVWIAAVMCEGVDKRDYIVPRELAGIIVWCRNAAKSQAA